MAARKTPPMDDDFSDLMNSVGCVDADVIRERWAVVAEIAATVLHGNLPRLVFTAHEVPVDRDEDRWFWEPFKGREDTFPIKDAQRLHAMLAGACLRLHIRAGEPLLDAHLVVLAANLMMSSPIEDLHDVARRSLLRGPAPTPAQLGTVPLSIAPPEEPVDGRVAALESGTQAAIESVVVAVDKLSAWAADAERRFDREQRVIQWLLAGTRADGSAWELLAPGVVALDAACELADLIDSPPQPHHVAVLSQILQLAGAPAEPVPIDLSGATAEPVSEGVDPGLAQLLPISCRTDPSLGSEEMSARDLASRALWERVTLAVWRRSA